MKVLITGGAGFIGHHLIEELLNHQYEVVVIDNLVTGFIENVSSKAKFYQFELNNPKLEDVFEQEKPDYIIHLAAQTSVTASMSDPYFDFNTNTAGTLKVLLLANRYHVKKFIFASSAAVYGEPNYLPIDEIHSINPQSFYSLSKYSAEKYIEYNNVYNGLDYCILRFSNVYGPRQNPNGEAGVISIFINRLLANESICIYDGNQTRDFVFVKDVAVACRLTLEGKHTGVFNISSCTETKIDELLDQIANVVEISTKPVYAPPRTGDIVRSTLDNGRARSELHWRTQYSLSDGLKETVQYYFANYFPTQILKERVQSH